MDNLLDCAICLEKYDGKEKAPRILKCGHTFCTKCLKELTKMGNNLGEVLTPYIKCPIDKLIGHPNKNVEEIPINRYNNYSRLYRIIVDILDYNGFSMDKLSIKDEDKTAEKLLYINSAYEKLKDLDNFFNCSYNEIRDNILQFMTAKNNCISEVSMHYDKLISLMVEKKEENILILESFSKEKLGQYNNMLKIIDQYRQIAYNGLGRLEMIKNQKVVTKIPISDELKIVNDLGFEQLEDKNLKKEIELILNEMKGDFCPKMTIQNEFDNNLSVLLDSAKVILPKLDHPFEISNLNDEMNLLNLSGDYYWFQHNSRNVYKMCISEGGNWVLVENKDNFMLSEMYRVCPIATEEALITGGGSGFLCSGITIHFKKGNFRRKQNMFYERRTHSSCKAGDFVYVCGGINSKGDPMNSCEKYSLEYEKWIKTANMISAKSHLSLCSVNDDYIFSFGGENKYESLLDSIERYCIGLDIWELMSIHLPVKIECCACVQSSQSEILVMGGYTCENGSLSSVYCFNFTNNTVHKKNKDLSQPGWSIYSPVKLGNSIHLFYGGEENFPPHHVIYLNEV